jgi:hypothetical protein
LQRVLHRNGLGQVAKVVGSVQTLDRQCERGSEMTRVRSAILVKKSTLLPEPLLLENGRQECRMTGTPSQIEWAEQIKPRVNAEFDRVAMALLAAAGHQMEQDRVDTQTVIAILEEKRAEVMANDRAGYFIRDWQELRDQVQRLIGQDARYQAIKARKAARQQTKWRLGT